MNTNLPAPDDKQPTRFILPDTSIISWGFGLELLVPMVDELIAHLASVNAAAKFHITADLSPQGGFLLHFDDGGPEFGTIKFTFWNGTFELQADTILEELEGFSGKPPFAG